MTEQEIFKEKKFVLVRNMLDPYLVEFLASYYQRMLDQNEGHFGLRWYLA